MWHLFKSLFTLIRAYWLRGSRSTHLTWISFLSKLYALPYVKALIFKRTRVISDMIIILSHVQFCACAIGIACIYFTLKKETSLVQSLIKPLRTQDRVRVAVCPFRVVKYRQVVAEAPRTATQHSYTESCSPGYPATGASACGYASRCQQSPRQRTPSPLSGNPVVMSRETMAEKARSFWTRGQRTSMDSWAWTGWRRPGPRQQPPPPQPCRGCWVETRKAPRSVSRPLSALRVLPSYMPRGRRICLFSSKSWAFSWVCICSRGVPSCASPAVASPRQWTASFRTPWEVSTPPRVFCWSRSCAFSGSPGPFFAVGLWTTP